MTSVSLREHVVLFDTHLLQLTVANLLGGFFPVHTLVVSLASTTVCGALAFGTRASASPSPLLFSSFSSFAAICITALMVATLLYRLTGGRFVCTARSTGDVVDWLVDATSRPLAEDTATMLLAPDRRRARGCFFIGLCLLAEVGKVVSFWSICTLLSLVWFGWSVRHLWIQRREKEN
ncbi:hypothetical protein ABB37_02830 [Leptomonas pyrrhocoris]|uniref:Transmembrane protein n=1 Tax=Leptomonas pyrrhocoris TaxID=157538 RepID=A0A0M9G6A6_LEPPY|nr:hypothetical protein ABB37_02830 [Leptomonas pyrrhocoris]XP_015661568.1 hypothetical protein ABB37_02830 [Leptomonas pyrrhocoris]XP_015661569.1 hypothetical protein ABB37_02830 [Leptomonas pyrrhocoris]KPA83128.1 hypothetical protein ABB37_02830 [Leptomonas pyrrhocoris]KPA83129.1 hypothetical protein ABB37_02830 [Leptomonas pyrrhocoris]KPA83130.1 hypothetical protein ABB37_02830 [Leptomonas pyrrhocoris]|eukprot:XP_015661567.1 hypothetical protein ABB37_02830 [Leptomonas pyrrhocoris]